MSLQHCCLAYPELRPNCIEKEAKNSNKIYTASRKPATISVLPVPTVSIQLGYSDATAFGRSFKQWTAMTPEAYRRSRSNSR
ncbi:MAG: helix-turn-helix domain-containing protein [Porticoccaceae bacterium]